MNIQEIKITDFSNLIIGKRRYNIKLWKTFTDCFNCLPVAALIDEKIFCMHGGLSPELTNLE